MRERKPWSIEHVELLKKLYPDAPSADLVRIFDRSIDCIYRKAYDLGVHRSEAYLASPAACRLRRGDNVGKEFRFKKGQAAWNKGVSYQPTGRSVETRFKKGIVPKNTQPVGSYRITKDNTLQRKISDKPGNNSVRWRSVHELVWIEANGPVPDGHRVIFKEGRKTTELSEITLDAVECLTYAEIMRRNSIHRYPKELAQLVQLRGALNRKINNMESRNE